MAPPSLFRGPFATTAEAQEMMERFRLLYPDTIAFWHRMDRLKCVMDRSPLAYAALILDGKTSTEAVDILYQEPLP